MIDDVIDIGLPSLSSDKLEEIGSIIEEKVFDYLKDNKYIDIIADFSFSISLEQEEDNLLKVNVDIETSGAMTSSQLDEFHKEINQLVFTWLEETLKCYKNSER